MKADRTRDSIFQPAIVENENILTDRG